MPSQQPLDVRAQLRGRRLIVVGGTGFLGKVWLSMLLARLPEVAHIYLMVRPRKTQTSEARFWADVASSPVFDPLREAHPGAAFEAFLKEKITPIPGDVSLPFAGVPDALRASLTGQIDAIVNVAGVVDFSPPLDEALQVNAFGMMSLVDLARALGDVPVLHTSTCYVAGGRTGAVPEINPLDFPFPRADELDRSHWDPSREIQECQAIIDSVRDRCNDAFRESAFLAEAKVNLEKKGEPTRGTALDDERKKVRRRFEKDRLIAAGTERAQFWGWPNIYTYTKSLGEQILARSGLRFTIARPAIIESSVAFPCVGWNEGINTSAPIIYLGIQGTLGVPAGQDSVLDLIPVDMVSAGMILSLAELLEGTHAPVYQYGSSDTNPIRMHRIVELTGLYKRKHYQNRAKGNPIVNWVQAHYEPIPFTAETYYERGPRAIGKVASGISGLLKAAGRGVDVLSPLTGAVSTALDGLSKTMDRSAWVLDQFVPFMAVYNYRFSCEETRRAFRRLSPGEQALLPWCPETIDWRAYMMEIHIPGLERHVMPEIEAKARRSVKPLRRHDTLLDFLDEVAERQAHVPALQYTQPDGFATVSYKQLRERAHAVAARLRVEGLQPGDRVLLAGRNHPDWVIGWFGIIAAGGVAVPVDPALAPDAACNIAQAAKLSCAVLDAKAQSSFGAALEAQGARLHDLHALSVPIGAVALERPPTTPDDLASVLFTSGTTGTPKGVMLTHRNFTSLIASIGQVFEITPEDRVLSVLPLHHTFEFTCGLLLPLAMGARIIYLDEINGEKLIKTLKEGRVTAMVGVPALWQLLERRIESQVREQGPIPAAIFDAGLEFSRMIGKKTGVDIGRTLFSVVHGRLGGNIRLLISGGAALPKETHEFFQGLGLHLAEGYGLTEAAPVLTVQPGSPTAPSGTVGKAIPGIEIKILAPDANGVGEVLARGPNVMVGYYGNEEATRAVLDDEGWLHTGDLGRLTHAGKLVLVGRAKEVVVTATGENIYLDDAEARLGRIDGVKEYVLVGVPDARGGERLAMAAVPDTTPDVIDPSKHRQAIKAAVDRLPLLLRPSVVEIFHEDLPRTATRKIKRKEVAEQVARRLDVPAELRPEDASMSPSVRRAVARVAGVDVHTIRSATRFREDLRFDSLMVVELLAELDHLTHAAAVLSAESVSRCETVGELDALLHAPRPTLHGAERRLLTDGERERFRIPAPLVPPLKALLGEGQRRLYEDALDLTVYGRGFIPYNRPTIVISNHTSHLDMGLVKIALGSYGQRLVALAAQDYFFEGNKYWVAYFEQLTNLQPLDRSGNLRKSLEQAQQVIAEGKVVLIFPEGTRQSGGEVAAFKPLIAKLAFETNTDVLPLYLDGPERILPKGAILPRSRTLAVRIGPPITVAELRRLTEGLRPAEAARAATKILREAVVALSHGQVLDTASLQPSDALVREAAEDTPARDPVLTYMESLPARFRATEYPHTRSWYWTLGDAHKWTVSVEGGAVQVTRGRPPSGSADCVIKTHPEMFLRLVRDAYVPEPAEFVSGVIKTNEIPLLLEFAQAFQLGPVAESEGGARA